MQIENYCRNGGNIFVSGSRVATDMYHDSDTTDNDIRFIEEVLKCRLRNSHGSQNGKARVVQTPAHGFEASRLSFYNEPNAFSYYVEMPDAIEPVDKQGYTICRYADNNLSAGMVYDTGNNKICVLGFPFETIKEENERNKLMKGILEFFTPLASPYQPEEGELKQ